MCVYHCVRMYIVQQCEVNIHVIAELHRILATTWEASNPHMWQLWCWLQLTLPLIRINFMYTLDVCTCHIALASSAQSTHCVRWLKTSSGAPSTFASASHPVRPTVPLQLSRPTGGTYPCNTLGAAVLYCIVLYCTVLYCCMVCCWCVVYACMYVCTYLRT